MDDEALIAGTPDSAVLNEELLAPMWRPTSLAWWGAFGLAGAGTLLFLVAIVWTVWIGIGKWGNNIPVGWAFGIIDFVFWIEIAHAGTFISAVLLLLEQKWRTSINRIAEAMTLFAVAQAGLFPLLHLGRPWFGYWLIVYPNTMHVWPQFKSALPWDAAAVFTYAVVSFFFWYMGLIPDLAQLRDSAPGKARRVIYGIFAMGWNGSARAMKHFRAAYGLLAGMATVLVISVISIISTDFSIAVLPGWHSTIFPPYFIAAALYSGFGLVTTLVVVIRTFFKMHNVVTERHLDLFGKMLLVMGLLTLYCYFIEFFIGWYSGDRYEQYTYWTQFFSGRGAWVWWLTLACTFLCNVFWFRRARTSPLFLFIVSILVNVGMWGDRFSFIVLSLERDFLPSSWRPYTPTWVDWSLLGGSVSFFSLLFLLFLRFVPFIPVAEVKELAAELNKHRKNGEAA